MITTLQLSKALGKRHGHIIDKALKEYTMEKGEYTDSLNRSRTLYNLSIKQALKIAFSYDLSKDQKNNILKLL